MISAQGRNSEDHSANVFYEEDIVRYRRLFDNCTSMRESRLLVLGGFVRIQALPDRNGSVESSSFFSARPFFQNKSVRTLSVRVPKDHKDKKRSDPEERTPATISKHFARRHIASPATILSPTLFCSPKQKAGVVRSLQIVVRGHRLLVVSSKKISSPRRKFY